MIEGKLIPVIHMLNEEQVIVNVSTCISEGVNRVFLINHSLDNYHLLRTAQMLKKNYPDLWVGVNLLGKPTEEVIQTDVSYLDAIWADNGLTHLSNEELDKIFNLRKFKGMFFGGLAFKYQKQPTDLKDACEKAIKFLDVPTTSGSGTGQAATKTKIEGIRKMLGDKPLALASGVDIENISIYAGLVNYYLVASSITGNDEIIDPDKLGGLRDKLLSIQ